MFTRHETLKLKANSELEFTRLNECQVIPLLRKQEGFCGQMILTAPERSEAVSISLWNTRETAEYYGQTEYPQVLSNLDGVVEGTPHVVTFQMSNSTFYESRAVKEERIHIPFSYEFARED